MDQQNEHERLLERVAELEASNDEMKREIERFRREIEELRLGEERYRSLIEATTAIVWNAPSSGDFETEQPRWGEFTGQTFEELKGWGWLNAVHPDDRPNTARVWSAAVASRSLYEVEHRLRRYDGAYRHMLVRAVPILDRLGKIREWVGVHTDFTAQKEVEIALLEAKAMAEAASQAKSDFLANMSHEIRTPINGVLGMTELALDTDLTSEQRSYLDLVKISADSLLVIVNDILDFSKIEAGKFELEAVAFSLRDRLGDTLKTLALKAHEKGLELACHFAPEVADALVGDAARLGQVILNLVGNAIKFTTEGEVVLSVRAGGFASAEFLLPTEGVDSQCYENAVLPLSEGFVTLWFSVRDTGSGIPLDKQSRMFQPFTQADTSTTRMFGGTGLGLTIAKRLVELMGGRIGFESEPGVGSTFYFTASFGLRTPRVSAAAPVRLQGQRILVVDDNNTNRLILEEVLSRWGAIPTLAEGATAALAVLDDAAAECSPFSLVLSDVMMPGVDGFQLAERITRRKDCVGVPVILLSSAGRQPTSELCRQAGVVACLGKPVKQSELFDAVLTALESSPQRTKASKIEPEPTSNMAPERSSRRLSLLLAEDNATNRLLAVTLLEKVGHCVETAQNGREAAGTSGLAHIRCGAYGRPDARDGRLRSDGENSAARTIDRQTYTNNRYDRACHEGGSTALPRFRHGRLHLEAHPFKRAL